MPNVAANLDPDTAAALSAAATEMAAGSPFVAEPRFYKVTLLGSLHTYEDGEVQRTISTLAPALPLQGRFVKWEIAARRLRVAVECEPAVEELQRALHSRLPRGRLWTSAYITVGYCGAIPIAQHEAFLQAVESSYPITTESAFTLSSLAYENDASERPPKPAATAKHSGGRAVNILVRRNQLPSKPKAPRPSSSARRPRCPSAITGTTVAESTSTSGVAAMDLGDRRTVTTIRKRSSTKSRNKSWSRAAA